MTLLPISFFLIAAIHGFVFCRTSWVLRYRIARTTGYHATLSYVASGVPATLLAYWVVGAHVDAHPSAALSAFAGLVPVGIVGAAFALVFGVMHNLLITGSKERALRATSDQVDRLLLEALDGGKQVVLALANRRVYAGYVWETTEPEHAADSSSISSWITILPVHVGHLDEKSLVVRITTTELSQSIAQVRGRIEAKDLRNYRLAIPKSEIVECSLLSEETDRQFHAKAEEARERARAERAGEVSGGPGPADRA